MRYLSFILLILLACSVCTCPAHGQTPEQEILIRELAADHGIDPELALSIAEVESGFNSNAVGALGELGIFQLRPEFHGEQLSRDDRNAHVGVRYLASVRGTCLSRYGEAWFICFNRGPYRKPPSDPKATSYYKRVTAVYNERVARGEK